MAGRLLVTTGPIVPRRGPRAATSAAPLGETGTAAPAATLWSAVLHGEPTVRRRMHEVVVADGIARLVTSRPARLWQSRALAQLHGCRPLRPLAVDLALECRICSAAGPDEIDDALLVEVLERAAIIAHRRQIRERHLVAARDLDHPRIILRLARFAGLA